MDNEENEKIQEEQKQRESSIDRVNSVIDGGRNLYNKAQTAKKIYNTIKTARTAATAAQAGIEAAEAGIASAEAGGAVISGAAATSEVWVPALIILIGAVVFFIIIAAVITNVTGTSSSKDNGAQANLTTTCTGTCSTDSTCKTVSKSSIPDANGATCQADSNGNSQTCCVQPQTCESIGGRCSATANCSDIPGTKPDTTGAICKDATTPICCVQPNKQPPIHFFCQYDPSYSNCSVTYFSNGACSNNSCNGNTTCDLIHNGCTPTSIAMILASYGKNFNPKTTALAAQGAGCLCNGSYSTEFEPLITSQGLKFYSGINLASGNSFNTQLAQRYLSMGCFLTAAADMTYSEGGPNKWDGSGNHQVVITAIDSNGVLTVYDPTWCTNDTSYQARHFSVNDTSNVNHWIQVFPICQ